MNTVRSKIIPQNSYLNITVMSLQDNPISLNYKIQYEKLLQFDILKVIDDKDNNY